MMTKTQRKVVDWQKTEPSFIVVVVQRAKRHGDFNEISPSPT